MAPQGCTAGAPSPFSDERLSAFVDGDLPGSELAQVRQHVDACAACALRAEELRGLARAARALEAPEAPATLWAGIEGAHEQAIRRCGLRQCRDIGQAKAHLQHLLTATALNVVRLSEWWAGTPWSRTRCSRFAALQLAA